MWQVDYCHDKMSYSQCIDIAIYDMIYSVQILMIVHPYSVQTL